MPLNSRRVTGPILRSVAATLELPTRASAEELRQMIDGRLEELGGEPRDLLWSGGLWKPTCLGTYGSMTVRGRSWMESLLPAEEPEGSVGEANAGAIVHGDRTPDREATLLAEHYRA